MITFGAGVGVGVGAGGGSSMLKRLTALALKDATYSCAPLGLTATPNELDSALAGAIGEQPVSEPAQLANVGLPLSAMVK